MIPTHACVSTHASHDFEFLSPIRTVFRQMYYITTGNTCVSGSIVKVENSTSLLFLQRPNKERQQHTVGRGHRM